MRNLGYNFLWYDKFSQNIFAKGFLSDISRDFDKYNIEFILNPNKEPVLRDIENLNRQKL